ncbi:hypothetical protein FBZ91_101156 [Nitrospirillum viridazoti]|nr:hypothetical protein FBZ91_101156 [Nitrospirillum amazonense]
MPFDATDLVKNVYRIRAVHRAEPAMDRSAVQRQGLVENVGA